MKKLLLIILLASSLQGCIFVAGAAAGAAAITVVYDHRKISKIAQDKTIAKKVWENLQADPDIKQNTHIEVTCFNQMLLLTGEAPTAELRQRAEDIANQTPDIRRIYNQVTVQGPTSTLTHASDSWITTKIATQMLANEALKSSTIKVVTENGTVYLMGIVTKEQADIAVDIARQVSGVQKVMKIFQYTEN